MTKQELLERLKAAEGPDREIDARIWVALCDPDVMADGGGYRGERPVTYVKASTLINDWKGDWEGLCGLVGAPHLTDSIDASLALVESQGFVLHYAHRDKRGSYHVILCLPDKADMDWEGEHKSFHYAILTALVSALIEREG